MYNIYLSLSLYIYIYICIYIYIYAYIRTKGQGSASGGVVGMLEVIASDFQRLKAETTAEEMTAANEYDTFMSESTISKEQYYAILYCTIIDSTILHYTTLHYTTLHYTTL